MTDITRKKHKGNARSVEAHESIKKDKSRQQALIYKYINSRRKHGSNCEEVEKVLSLKHQTASARISEMKRSGDLIPVDKRRTMSGRNADVYVTPKYYRGKS